MEDLFYAAAGAAEVYRFEATSSGGAVHPLGRAIRSSTMLEAESGRLRGSGGRAPGEAIVRRAEEEGRAFIALRVPAEGAKAKRYAGGVLRTTGDEGMMEDLLHAAASAAEVYRFGATSVYRTGLASEGRRPRAVWHRHGARVALLRSSIPHDGASIVTQSAGGQKAVNSEGLGAEPPGVRVFWRASGRMNAGMSLRGAQRRSNLNPRVGDCFASLAMTCLCSFR